MCIGPEAETTGDPGTCTERLENFEDGTPASREFDAQRKFYRTGASPNELATQLECEGEFVDAQCTDTDEAGILQYCLPECTHILDDSQTCNSIPLGAGDKCSDFAEQFSPFVRFPDGQEFFFADNAGSMTASAWHRQCKPNTDSSSGAAPCMSSEHDWTSGGQNENPSTCLPPRPPLHTNPGVTCSAKNGGVQYNVVVTSHITERRFFGSAGNRRIRGSMNVLDVPAAKCCTDSSASNCYGQNFSEEQKNTPPFNPFDHTYSCCHYVNQESNVVCTQTSSMDCSGIWTAQKGLTDDLPALEVIDNYWQADFDLEIAKLRDYCTSPYLFYAVNNVGSTLENKQIKFAVVISLFHVREMQEVYNVYPSFLVDHKHLITNQVQPTVNFDTLAGEYVRNFGGSITEQLSVYMELRNTRIHDYSQYFTPCVARDNLVDCESAFEILVPVDQWSESASFRHCVWSARSQTCSRGNDCRVTI